VISELNDKYDSHFMLCAILLLINLTILLLVHLAILLLMKLTAREDFSYCIRISKLSRLPSTRASRLSLFMKQLIHHDQDKLKCYNHQSHLYFNHCVVQNFCSNFFTQRLNESNAHKHYSNSSITSGVFFQTQVHKRTVTFVKSQTFSLQCQSQILDIELYHVLKPFLYIPYSISTVSLLLP